jgi:hypothetical protein
VRWIPDETGRIPVRPHFQPAEIDRECEALVARFLRERHGVVRFPLTTDDLTVLVERETADLDLYADLEDETHDTEGVTEFVPGERPSVRIARALSEDPRRTHRLRTTLAHELGHVLLHGCLWTLDAPPAAGRGAPVGINPRCRRATIERPDGGDWLEWQAGYASGAVLMPAGAVARLVAQVHGEARSPVVAGGTLAGRLERRLARDFDVSLPAARLRLLKLGHVAWPLAPLSAPRRPARPAGPGATNGRRAGSGR